MHHQLLFILTLFGIWNIMAQLAVLSSINSPVIPISAPMTTENGSAVPADLTTKPSSSASSHLTAASLSTTTITVVSVVESSVSNTSVTSTSSPHTSARTTDNQTFILPSISAQHLNSTTAKFANITTSITFITESLSLSLARPTSTFTSVVTVGTNPGNTTGANVATANPSMASGPATIARAKPGLGYLSIALFGTVVSALDMWVI